MNIWIIIIVAIVMAFIVPILIFRSWGAFPFIVGSLIIIAIVMMECITALPWEEEVISQQETYRVTLLESPLGQGQYLETEPDSNHHNRYVYHYLDESQQVQEGRIYWPTIQPTSEGSPAELVCYSVLTEYTVFDGRFHYRERTTKTVILLPKTADKEVTL